MALTGPKLAMLPLVVATRISPALLLVPPVVVKMPVPVMLPPVSSMRLPTGFVLATPEELPVCELMTPVLRVPVLVMRTKPESPPAKPWPATIAEPAPPLAVMAPLNVSTVAPLMVKVPASAPAKPALPTPPLVEIAKVEIAPWAEVSVTGLPRPMAVPEAMMAPVNVMSPPTPATLAAWLLTTIDPAAPPEPVPVAAPVSVAKEVREMLPDAALNRAMLPALPPLALPEPPAAPLALIPPAKVIPVWALKVTLPPLPPATFAAPVRPTAFMETDDACAKLMLPCVAVRLTLPALSAVPVRLLELIFNKVLLMLAARTVMSPPVVNKYPLILTSPTPVLS